MFSKNLVILSTGKRQAFTLTIRLLPAHFNNRSSLLGRRLNHPTIFILFYFIFNYNNNKKMLRHEYVNVMKGRGMKGRGNGDEEAERKQAIYCARVGEDDPYNQRCYPVKPGQCYKNILSTGRRKRVLKRHCTTSEKAKWDNNNKKRNKD
jgi:hypothetical protein